MKGHERRTKSTVLPLKKKIISFCFCLQHSALLAWERWGVNLIFIVSSPRARSSEAGEGRRVGWVSLLVWFWVGWGGGFFVVVFPFFESQSCFEKLQHTTEICWCCADSFVLFLKGVRLSTFCNFFHSAFPSFSILLIFKLKGQSRVFQRGFFCLHVYKYFWGKGVTEGGFINGRLRKTLQAEMEL